MATILDFTHEGPAGEHLPLVCQDACHMLLIWQSSIVGMALNAQVLAFRQEMRGMEGQLGQMMDNVMMSLAEHQSLLDQLSEYQSLLEIANARFAYYGKYTVSPCQPGTGNGGGPIHLPAQRGMTTSIWSRY